MTQMAIQNVDIVPGILDITLFGDGYAWRVELRLAALGDLTDAEIVAKFKPISGDTTELIVVRSPENDLLSKFSIGYDSTLPGYYTIVITKVGSLAHTYISGEIRVIKDMTS